MFFRSYVDSDVNALMSAVTTNSYARVESLLAEERGRRGCFSDWYTSFVDASALSGEFLGWTSLQIAALRGYDRVVRCLLTAGADPFLRTPVIEGKPSFTSFRVVQSLGSDLTPLMLAVMFGKLSVVQIFLDRGRYPRAYETLNVENKHHLRAILLAAQQGYADVVVWILQNCAHDVFTLNSLFENLLMFAIKTGNAICLERVQEALRPDVGGITYEDDEALVPLWSVNFPDLSGRTALSRAIEVGNLDAAKVLMPLWVAEVRKPTFDYKGKTIAAISDFLTGSNPFIFLAAQHGYIDIMDMLLAYHVGTDVGSRQLFLRDYRGDTALFRAVRYGKADAAIKLLSVGAEPIIKVAGGEELNLLKVALDKKNPHPEVVAKILAFARSSPGSSSSSALLSTLNTSYMEPGCCGETRYTLLDLVGNMRDAAPVESSLRDDCNAAIKALIENRAQSATGKIIRPEVKSVGAHSALVVAPPAVVQVVRVGGVGRGAASLKSSASSARMIFNPLAPGGR